VQSNSQKKNQIKDGLAIRGNWNKLQRLFDRAKNGDDILLGFIGGSITQGSLATKEEFQYVNRVVAWWRQQFPKATITHVNAGIGGTSSHYGVARVEKDLLIYNPDIVFVDFTVNDKDTPFCQETFEGLLRKIIKSNENVPTVILNNIYYCDGYSAEKVHNQLGAYYDIPCISAKQGIYPLIAEGIYEEADITSDGLHPNDFGHELLAKILTTFFTQVLEEPVRDDLIAFPLTALTDNCYEESILYQRDNIDATYDGFTIDTRKKDGLLDLYKDGFFASLAGDSMKVNVTGSCIAVQYLKSVRHPVPIATAIIDGDVHASIKLDGNFDEDWGDCLYLEPILHHGIYGAHELEIRIKESSKYDVGPFYVVGIIVS
jgi:lysophospholipase L1-like esterase